MFHKKPVESGVSGKVWLAASDSPVSPADPRNCADG
jgi:hypothetical protein